MRLRTVRSIMLAVGFAWAFGLGVATPPAVAQTRKGPPKSQKGPPRTPVRKRIPPAIDFRAKAYKQRSRAQIAEIVRGNAAWLVEPLEEHLKQQPSDAESWYVLAIAHGQMGDTAEAVHAVHHALEAGLPLERFLAGPKSLLEPLTETEAFDELVADRVGKLIHGPMLGCVTDQSAKFWVRTAEEVPVQVVAGTSADMANALRSSTAFTDADRDFTAVIELERLEADTVYHYDLLIRGKPVLGPKRPSFRTFPAAEAPARFQVGFGGGAGYTPWKERMWDTIARQQLPAFLFLGDNVYIDTPEIPEVQRYAYYRRQSRAEFRRFVAATSIFAIWDDHDFSINDGWGGPDIKRPAWKVPVWEVFSENWNNPAYGGGRRRPGCWFRFGIADVDFFMLDGRYYRTDPNSQRPSMLGPVQKEWLFEGLKRSEATFKVLASPVPWVLEAKGRSLDTWRGFQAEREEIFSFLEENEIDGVILLSADRHRSDVWRIDREQGYPLYEFESSRLTNVHRHGLMPGALFGYNEKCSFGRLTFDTTRPDPQVTYDIFSIDGQRIHAFTVRRSEITHDRTR